ncbi:hypothetical protein [Acidaminobacterium chupaoyuni]
MPSEYENIAKLLMSSPQGTKIIKSLDKFSAIASSDSGKQLIAMLADEGGDAIKTAAQAAVRGDQDQARALLSSLLSTKSGAQLAAKIIEVASQQ